MRRFVFAILAVSLAGCGNPSSKLNNENPDGDVPVNAYEGPANSQYTQPEPPPASGVGGITGTGASSGSGGGFGGGGSGAAGFSQFLRTLCEYFVTCETDEVDFGFLTVDQCVTAYYDEPDADLQQCLESNPDGMQQCTNDLAGLQCQGLLENLPQSCLIALDANQCNGGVDVEDVNNGDTAEPPPAVNDGMETMIACDDDQVRASIDGEDVCLNPCGAEGECESGFVCNSGICVPEDFGG